MNERERTEQEVMMVERATLELAGRQHPPLSGDVTGLSPAGEAARQQVELSAINDFKRRVVASFLRDEDYRTTEHGEGNVLASLFMERLPALVREIGGEAVFTACFSDYSHDFSNVTESDVKVNGQRKRFMTEGSMFILAPQGHIVVSVKPTDSGAVTVRSVSSSGSHDWFVGAWESYTREHNFLRGQAFFADGELIERRKSYGWDDIFLADSVKEAIRMNVEGFLRNRERLQALGLRTRRGIILEGPPGTGKTLLGKVLAQTLGTSFMWVTPRLVGSPASLHHMMDLARFVAPTVVFLEDLDLFAEERNGKDSTTLGELMNQLDGVLENEHIITIGTTNHLHVVERAVRNRPGRFDRILNIGAMDESCRRRLFAKLLRKASISSEDLGRLVQATDGHTGAQIEELANTLCMLALDGNGHPGGNGAQVLIRPDVVAQALRAIPRDPAATTGFRTA